MSTTDLAAGQHLSSPISLPPLPAIVDGTVRHRRSVPFPTGFAHRLRLWLVDLDELPDHGRLASFDAADHLGDPTRSIRENVLAFCAAQGDPAPAGSRVVTLASPRVLGYVFNPLSVHWVIRPDGLEHAVVAEVHNTYGERHAYLLRRDGSPDAQVDKAFYVSPFFDVSGRYTMRVSLTPEQVFVSVLLRDEDGGEQFFASYGGSFSPVTGTAARRWARRLEPWRVSALIRAHGIALWARRLPVVPRQPHDPPAGVVEAPAPRTRRRTVLHRVPTRISVPLARRLGERAALTAGARVAYPDGRVVGGHGPVLEVLEPRAFFERVAREPKFAIGEGYMAQEWRARGDLGELLTPFAARMTELVPESLLRLRALADQAHPGATRNSRDGARRNIEAHYDLSNELFAIFLDETMTYSSGLFQRGNRDDLVAAQVAKMDAVLDRAQVGPGTRVLEIGTGWGALALRAAARGAQVTTVTLSREQAALAVERITTAGLADRVDVRLQDYRDVTGQFDAVVSVEMIEAVGEEYWPTYFASIDRCLAPGGRAVVQAITMDDARLRATRHSHGWIQEHIFPGGLIPSVEALDEACGGTRLRRTDAVAFGQDYARTLRLWRQRFMARLEQVHAAGFDDRFVRMWEFYLAYCEAGFAAGYLDVQHLTYTRDEEQR